MSQDIRIALFQSDMVWEEAAENCRRNGLLLERYFTQTKEVPHLIVFPEFFTTGFSMNPDIAEDADGISARWMRDVSRRFGVAVVGSIPTKADGFIYNRCYFVTSDGDEWHYDKRHLFRMSDENKVYSPGEERVIVSYQSWRIALNICYDLRFPVWSRNKGLEYDLMINIASWPDTRIFLTEHLVKARAIENMSYFAFVNRVGESPSDSYNGCSRIVSPKGEDIAREESIEGVKVLSATLSKSAMEIFRNKFPAWMDAD